MYATYFKNKCVYEFMYWGRERERMIKLNVKNW